MNHEQDIIACLDAICYIFENITEVPGVAWNIRIENLRYRIESLKKGIK